MFVQRQDVTLTTDGSGDCTASSTVLTGQVLGIVFDVGTLANTADVTVTATSTSEPIITVTNLAASGAYYPRTQLHSTAAAGLTLDGTRTMVGPVCVADDRIRFVVAQGGASKTGTATLIIG